MQTSTLVVRILTVALCMSGIAYARNNAVYTPPERISCFLSSTEQLSCGDFNRQYLSEGLYTADFKQGQEQSFTFSSAAAYFTTNHQEARVIFTYRNDERKVVRLETFNTSIQPDLGSGSWRALNNSNDVYVCSEGYKNCGITNLPSN